MQHTQAWRPTNSRIGRLPNEVWNFHEAVRKIARCRTWDIGMLTLSFLIPCLLDPCIPLSHNRRSRKFATDSQLFTWMDENGADLTVRRIVTQQPYHTHSSEQLVAGESSTSERIAILNEQTGTLRIGSLGMRMLHMDILVVTSVVMLHRRWQRFHR